MGIVAFKWAEGNNNQLTVLMNRDNWENRAISAAAWDGTEQVLSGRCDENSGTWLGISKRGRVAFLVSSSLITDRIERFSGSEIYPGLFLHENTSPEQFANNLARDDHLDQGHVYSLIVADLNLHSMVHIRKPVVHEPNLIIENVPFGVHTLSPMGLNSTQSLRGLRLRGFFDQLIGRFGVDNLPPLEQIAREFMYNADGADAVFLETMADHPTVQELGKIRFGTTSTTVLVVERTGRAALFERYRLINGAWDMNHFDFSIQH